MGRQQAAAGGVEVLLAHRGGKDVVAIAVRLAAEGAQVGVFAPERGVAVGGSEAGEGEQSVLAQPEWQRRQEPEPEQTPAGHLRVGVGPENRRVADAAEGGRSETCGAQREVEPQFGGVLTAGLDNEDRVDRFLHGLSARSVRRAARRRGACAAVGQTHPVGHLSGFVEHPLAQKPIGGVGSGLRIWRAHRVGRGDSGLRGCRRGRGGDRPSGQGDRDRRRLGQRGDVPSGDRRHRSRIGDRSGQVRSRRPRAHPRQRGDRIRCGGGGGSRAALGRGS